MYVSLLIIFFHLFALACAAHVAGESATATAQVYQHPSPGQRHYKVANDNGISCGALPSALCAGWAVDHNATAGQMRGRRRIAARICHITISSHLSHQRSRSTLGGVGEDIDGKNLPESRTEHPCIVNLSPVRSLQSGLYSVVVAASCWLGSVEPAIAAACGNSCE